MKRNIRSILSKALIAIGTLILVGLLIYEAVGYPWHKVLSDLGLMEADTLETLPEPSPLPELLLKPELTWDPDDVPQEAPVEESLPGTSYTFTLPEVDLIPIGTIKIPATGVSEHVVEGAGNELHYAVGHIRATAMPGQAGNCALAAHRNFSHARAFRHNDKLQVGDEVYVTVGEETYLYTIYESIIVLPSEVWVLELPEGESHVLTLITCTPLGISSHRIVIHARLAGTEAVEIPARPDAPAQEIDEATPDEPQTPEPTGEDAPSPPPAEPDPEETPEEFETIPEGIPVEEPEA